MGPGSSGAGRRLGASVLVVSLAATGAAGSSGAADPSTIGAAGIGDPYYPFYGNGGYDVAHYTIRVAYDLRSRRLTGDTTVTAVATQDLTRFDLDLRLGVTGVSVDGRAAAFRRYGRELEITPGVPLSAGQRFRVRVRYGGKPRRDPASGIGWMRSRSGVATMGEPEVATSWFPSNDHPRDKATYDIVVSTTPARQVVSNGTLVSRTRTRRSARWHWRETSPMVTYAALLAIGNFTFRRGATPGGVPYLYAISRRLPRETRRNARKSLKVTPTAVDLFARTFGPYPFGSAGAVVTDVPAGVAMETQTKPSYGRYVFGRRNRDVVVHELAHQWFGNSISVTNWRDLWLNEGFATWAELFYGERISGVPANRAFAQLFREHRRDPEIWRTRLTAPDPRMLFGPDVYFRGAMAVQALRNLAGRGAFLQLVRAWVAEHRHGDASTEDFVALATRLTDADVDRWRQIWLERPARPAVTRANGFPARMLRR